MPYTQGGALYTGWCLTNRVVPNIGWFLIQGGATNSLYISVIYKVVPPGLMILAAT